MIRLRDVQLRWTTPFSGQTYEVLTVWYKGKFLGDVILRNDNCSIFKSLVPALDSTFIEEPLGLNDFKKWFIQNYGSKLETIT